MPQGRDEAGQLWEYDGLDANGDPINPRPVSAPSRGTVYTPPPKAEKPREAPSGYRWTAGGGLEVIPGGPADKPEPGSQSQGAADVTAKVRQDAIRQFYGANALTGKTGQLAGQYRTGPGATKGVSGISDMFPTESNRRFDDAGLQLRGYVKDALGFTGGEGNTVGEVQLNYGPYLPEASDWDGRIEGKIGALYGLANDSRKRAIATLGGVPDANGVIHPLGSPQAEQILSSVGHGRVPNVWDQPSAQAPERQGAQGSVANALTGNTRTRYERNPEIERIVAAAFRRGASIEELNAITVPAGYGPINPAEYGQALQARSKGQGGDVTFTIGKNVPLSRMEELSGSSTGAALAGIGNAGSFGGVKALAREQYDAMEQANPGAMLGGEVLGSIAGTSILGRLGKETLGRALPGFAQGGGRFGNLARGVGTDATYSGIYGGVTGDGALPSAAQGALGSVAGRGVGKVLGGTIGGLARAPGADELASRGVPLTVGQNAGGMLKGFEDRLTSVPVVGDMVNARRVEGFQGFQKALQNEAGQPIGAKFDGGDWRGAMPDEFGQAYDNATAGVNVPLDAQFFDELQKARAAGRQLPPDLAAKFDRAVANRVDPIANQKPYYHGSEADIAGELRPGENGLLGPGIYFTPDKQRALTYAGAKGDAGIHVRAVDGPFIDLEGYLGAVDDYRGQHGGMGKDAATRRLQALATQDMLKSRGFNGIQATDAGGYPAINVINPAAVRPFGMTGETYQQAIRGLKGYKAEMTKPGFEGDYREALTGAQDVLKGQMMRGGGQNVVEGLSNADKAYRMAKVVQEAQNKAANASLSGIPGLPAPSQFNAAATANAKKFGGVRPFAELIDAAQSVMPSKIGDSGTSGRLAQMALPSLLVGGAGVGYSSNGVEGAGAGALPSLALASLLAAGGSKGGQKAINALLFKRGALPKKAAALIRKQQGLFGAAAVPLALEAGN